MVKNHNNVIVFFLFHFYVDFFLVQFNAFGLTYLYGSIGLGRRKVEIEYALKNFGLLSHKAILGLWNKSKNYF